jgi:hypothetical protein
MGAFVILSLLERQEFEFGYEIRSEFYIEFYVTIGNAVDILHDTGILFGGRRLAARRFSGTRIPIKLTASGNRSVFTRTNM